MARKLPALGLQFSGAVDRALELAEAAERIRAALPTGSAAKELPLWRIEAIYEVAYLRVFLLWEDLLEQTFLRFMCGFASMTHTPSLLNPRQKTISDAERALLGTRDFVPWAHPGYVVKRSKDHFVNGPHETVLASNFARLEAFNSVRNRIAHRSDFARQQFDLATISLVGRRYPASSPGRFLRDKALGTSTPEPWLSTIAKELKSLASQVSP